MYVFVAVRWEPTLNSNFTAWGKDAPDVQYGFENEVSLKKAPPQCLDEVVLIDQVVVCTTTTAHRSGLRNRLLHISQLLPWFRDEGGSLPSQRFQVSHRGGFTFQLAACGTGTLPLGSLPVGYSQLKQYSKTTSRTFSIFTKALSPWSYPHKRLVWAGGVDNE